MMFLGGFGLFKFPLQHYITLSRFQHYGICLYVWALGFFLQTIWSWKSLTLRGRVCLLSTGCYAGIIARIFYENPWLDSNMAIQTNELCKQKMLFTFLCSLLGFIVFVFWLVWAIEEERPTEEKNS